MAKPFSRLPWCVFLLFLPLMSGQTSSESRAKSAPAVQPTPGDVLRGSYGPFRANNDLLSYHLDIRVDPGQEAHQRKEHDPVQDNSGTC